jgi:hypothetical protein
VEVVFLFVGNFFSGGVSLVASGEWGGAFMEGSILEVQGAFVEGPILEVQAKGVTRSVRRWRSACVFRKRIKEHIYKGWSREFLAKAWYLKDTPTGRCRAWMNRGRGPGYKVLKSLPVEEGRGGKGRGGGKYSKSPPYRVVRAVCRVCGYLIEVARVPSAEWGFVAGRGRMASHTLSCARCARLRIANAPPLRQGPYPDSYSWREGEPSSRLSLGEGGGMSVPKSGRPVSASWRAGLPRSEGESLIRRRWGWGW